MNFLDQLTVQPGSNVDLSQIDPNETFGVSRKKAEKQTQRNQERIAQLQEMLYAEHKQNVLIVLTGIDTSGKDGTIISIAGAMNPQGVRVASFKKPTPEELKHDFLWRVEKQMPGQTEANKGEVVFFNRSHYEDVLVVRVHNIVPPDVWEKRYDQINNFEREHVAKGTHILKIFLHISKDEQLERLKDRMDDPEKRWKISAADFKERPFWEDYQRAFEAALSKCSTDEAPWVVVPANHKWFRDYAVSEIAVRYLEGLHMQYPDNVANIAEARKAYEAEMAAQGPKPCCRHAGKQFNPKAG